MGAWLAGVPPGGPSPRGPRPHPRVACLGDCVLPGGTRRGGVLHWPRRMMRWLPDHHHRRSPRAAGAPRGGLQGPSARGWRGTSDSLAWRPFLGSLLGLSGALSRVHPGHRPGGSARRPSCRPVAAEPPSTPPMRLAARAQTSVRLAASIPVFGSLLGSSLAWASPSVLVTRGPAHPRPRRPLRGPRGRGILAAPCLPSPILQGRKAVPAPPGDQVTLPDPCFWKKGRVCEIQGVSVRIIKWLRRARRKWPCASWA